MDVDELRRRQRLEELTQQASDDMGREDQASSSFGGLGLATQTRQHYATPVEPLPDLSQMPDPRAHGLFAQDDPRLQPSRGFLVNEPKSLPGVPGLSEGQRMADDIQDMFYGLPVGLRMSLAEQGGIPQLANAMMLQRQLQAYRLEQIKEQKRHHDLGLLEKAMTHPQAKMMLEQLGKTQGYSMAPQAKMLAKGMSDTMFSSMQAISDVLPQAVRKKFIDGDMNYEEMTTWLKTGQKIIQENYEHEVQANLLEEAKALPEESRSAFQKRLVKEEQERTGKIESETFAKQAEGIKDIAQAQKFSVDAARGPNERDLGVDREAFTLQLFGDKYGRNVRYRDLTVAEQQAVNNSVAKYLGQQTGFRTEASQGAMDRVPVGRLGKAQEYRDPVTGRAAPSWATPEQLQQLGYVNIEPSQIGTVNQLTNVDAAINEIASDGISLLRKQGVSKWTDIPAGIAQIPLLKLLKKYSGNPEVERLQSAINRITPTLSRLGGDVANVAVAEREMYASSIFNDADTVESFAKKIESIKNANRRTRSSMGFVEDERAYISQLVARGKTDEEIKALVKERKRFK